MVRMGSQTVSILGFIAAGMILSSCAVKRSQEVKPAPSVAEKKATAQSKAKKTETPVTAKTTERVVGPKDLAALETMNKAVELYIVKKQPQEFTRLCQDKRFECFVDEKIFPGKKKKAARALPPYAAGSKMGLQGEKHVQIRYEFYP